MLSKFTGVAAATAVGVSATVAGAQSAAVQWRVEDGGNGHWYAVIPATTFDTASARAAELGGYLATSTSAAENARLVERLVTTSASRAHLGLVQLDNQAAVNDGWGWVTGEPITFSKWRCFGNEIRCAPDDTPCGVRPFRVENNQANCGALERNGDWDDLEKGAWCDNGTRVAIVEWSADCNNDGIVDYGQLLDGTFTDANSNGIPDSCDCLGDIDDDGWIDGVDLGGVLAAWGKAPAGTPADLNGDGAVDGTDLGVLLAGWGACAP
jgi:hypothetical protein